MLGNIMRKYTLTEIFHKMVQAVLDQANPVEILVVAAVVLLLFLTAAKRTREQNRRLFFCLSLAFILYITLFRRRVQSERMIKWSLLTLSGSMLFDDFLNALLFVPMGMALAAYKPRVNWLRAGFVCAGTSFFCEVMQYLFARGLADVDDLLFNVLGGLFGYALICAIRRVRRDRTPQKGKTALPCTKNSRPPKRE